MKTTQTLVFKSIKDGGIDNPKSIQIAENNNILLIVHKFRRAMNTSFDHLLPYDRSEYDFLLLYKHLMVIYDIPP
jgi:hypothetical protein